MSTSVDERRLIRWLFGLLLIAFGLVWIVARLWPELPEAEGRSYLGAVLARGLGDTYQMALLAAIPAVVLHGIMVAVRPLGAEGARAYDRLGALMQTLFTSFGFLGTIVGVSLAVAGLKKAMDAGEPDALVGGLSVAFDTTFLGLVGAIAVMVLRRMVALRHSAPEG